MRFLLDQDVPDDLSYILLQLGHDVALLRQVLPRDARDAAVLQFAADTHRILVTCNRDDFLKLAQTGAHRGIIILVRRRTRAAERTALFQLLLRAGEAGILDNINFA